MHRFIPAGLALALAAPLMAVAATPTEIDALRDEIAAMRSSYEARLQALELRLKAAEATSAPVGAAPAAAAPPPAAEPAAGGGSNAFNPSMSLILSGLYTNTSRDPARYAIKGFALPPNSGAGPGTRGFSLAESELGLAASIDPWLKGAANISLHPDDTVSVEEAFIQTTALDNGLGVKAGRFFSSVGYLNPQHSHTWDFVDNPLAYQAMLGTQYGDDGVQFSWLPPTDQYVELAAEFGRGRSFPGGDNSRNGAGMFALVAHTGGDIGDSNNWRAGLSVLNAKANDLSLIDTSPTGTSVSRLLSGHTRVTIADAIWKWAPHGNATQTSFKLQGEVLRSTRSGNLTDSGGNPAAIDATQSGWYLQGVYQFLPRWRAGLRLEALDAGHADGGGLHPRKTSLMVDYNASEFSRVRLQLAQDQANFGAADHQVFVLYQMSLGAHGAHSY